MDSQRRVVSGMRPSGRLHLGHYNGVLKNWVRLQHEYECFFCIVDWHALTTDYESSGEISQNIMDMAVDWLAAGVSPSSATLFIQSQVPRSEEHTSELQSLMRTSYAVFCLKQTNKI